MDYSQIRERVEQNNDLYTPRASKLSEGELKNAKAFLSVVNTTFDISMYDLLRQIIETILRHRIIDSVDRVESLCKALKQEKFEEKEEFKASPEISDKLLQHIDTLKKLFEEISEPKPVDTLREAQDDENLVQDEDTSDSLDEAILIIEEPSWTVSYIPDVCYQMFRFNQVGVGLGLDETFEINMAIKVLAKSFKLEKVRFWGKIFALDCDLYIAEAPYTKGVPEDNYGWAPFYLSKPKEVSVEGEITKDTPNLDTPTPAEVEATSQSHSEMTGESPISSAEESSIPLLPEIPPLPKAKPIIQPMVKPEENGTGINKYMYFVCSMPGRPWRVLPQLRPDQIVDARILKKYFTGQLDADIRGCVAFQGKQAHYLRAQIARISSATMVSPTGYYRQKETDTAEEQAADVAEDTQSPEIFEIEENPDFQPLPPKELFSEGLKAWVHHRPALLTQGRCVWTKSLEKLEVITNEQTEMPPIVQPVNPEESQEPAINEEPELKEKPIPLLRSLSEDRSAGGILPWTIKRSSSMISESAVLVARSNVWPGAFSYFDGKTTDHIYVGYGQKYTVQYYAPKLGQLWQKEYVVGSNLIEPIDEIVETTDPSETLETTPNTSTIQDGEMSSDVCEVKGE